MKLILRTSQTVRWNFLQSVLIKTAVNIQECKVELSKTAIVWESQSGFSSSETLKLWKNPEEQPPFV